MLLNQLTRKLARYGAIAAVVLGLAATVGAGTARAQDAGQAPVIATFRGNADGRASVVLGPTALHAGLVVVRARATSASIFSVELASAPAGLSPLTDYDFSRLVINSGLRYDGAVATLLPKDNDYYVVVSVSGAYVITLEQPDPTNVAPVETRRFTSVADDVTPVFALPAGTYTIHITSAATARLFASFFQVDDLGGSPVFESYDGRFIQVLSGPFDESATFTLRRRASSFSSSTLSRMTRRLTRRPGRSPSANQHIQTTLFCEGRSSEHCSGLRAFVPRRHRERRFPRRREPPLSKTEQSFKRQLRGYGCPVRRGTADAPSRCRRQTRGIFRPARRSI